MKPPIIIIGAGRSGTKILRDMLCLHPELVTWPCDEINPIWRYNHADYPNDELKPKHATQKVENYIRSKFRELSQKHGGKRVVEKTCANSLRVAYVHEIFPDAKFIHLIRDGRDVAESARRRWQGDFKIDYILKKAQFVPCLDIPYYLFQFLSNRFYQLVNKKDRLKTWGPRFSGIDEIVKEKSLIEVCGIQWKKCVEKVREDLKEISSQSYDLKYENMVRNSVEEFREIFKFSGLPIEDQLLSTIQNEITKDNIGKWKRGLSKEEIAKLMPHIKELMIELNYIQDE